MHTTLIRNQADDARHQEESFMPKNPQRRQNSVRTGKRRRPAASRRHAVAQRVQVSRDKRRDRRMWKIRIKQSFLRALNDRFLRLARNSA
jgi:hypothetical protein